MLSLYRFYQKFKKMIGVKLCYLRFFPLRGRLTRQDKTFIKRNVVYITKLLSLQFLNQYFNRWKRALQKPRSLYEGGLLTDIKKMYLQAEVNGYDKKT